MYVCMYVLEEHSMLWEYSAGVCCLHIMILFCTRVTERSRSVDLSRPFLQTCGTSIWDRLSRHFNLLAGFN